MTSPTNHQSSQAGDDQPTLHGILEDFRAACNVARDPEDRDMAFAEAEAAIRLLVEGAAPEKEYEPDDIQYPQHFAMAHAYNKAIDEYTENLRGRLGSLDDSKTSGEPA